MAKEMGNRAIAILYHATSAGRIPPKLLPQVISGALLVRGERVWFRKPWLFAIGFLIFSGGIDYSGVQV